MLAGDSREHYKGVEFIRMNLSPFESNEPL